MNLITKEILTEMIINDTARIINGYDNYYATRSGYIISSIPHNGTNIRFLKNGYINGGYNTVVLYENKKHRKFLVHRLIAAAFIENPLNLEFVNHKDEIKTNNCVENLEWCTRLYNNNYGTITDRSSLSHVDGKSCKKSCPNITRW